MYLLNVPVFGYWAKLYPTRLLPIKLFCPVTGFLATGASIDVITLWINKVEDQLAYINNSQIRMLALGIKKFGNIKIKKLRCGN